MHIEWHPLAQADLIQIVEYIAGDNPDAALRTVERFDRKVAMLSTLPQLGRIGRVPNTRELVITRSPYIVAYHLSGNVVLILRVLHGARRWPRKMAGL